MSDHGAICLKTGCLLSTPVGLFWGDLHCLNAATLIFNAARQNNEALCVDPEDYTPDHACLEYDGPFFERLGVFTLLAHCSEPNGALAKHYAEWGGPR